MVKTLLNRLWKYLASPKVGQTALLACAALTVLVLIPVQFLGLPSDQVKHLAERGILFLVLYLVLTAAVVACLWKRVKALKHSLSRTPPASGRLNRRGEESDAPFDPERALRAMRKAGYRRVAAGEGSVWGLRHPWSPLGTYVLHVSMVVVLLGAALVQLPWSFVGRARVTRGETFTGMASDYFEQGHGSVGVVGTGPRFTVTSVEASAPSGESPESLAVRMKSPDGRVRVLRAGSVWVFDPFSLVAVEDFGMSPKVSVIPSGSAEPTASVTAELQYPRALVPESVMFLSRSGTPLRLEITLTPGTARFSPPSRPAATLQLSRKEADGDWRVLGEPRTVIEGGSAKFGEFVVRLDSVQPYALLRVSRSFTSPLLLLGLLAAMAGPFLRLSFPRTQAAIQESAGKTSIVVGVDAYRESPGERRRLREEWEEAE